MMHEISTTRVYPKLTDTSSTGKIKEYLIWVESYTSGVAAIKTAWGYAGAKTQIKTKMVEVGKNIGKKNETTPYKQACKEALSTWKRKVDAGYSAIDGVSDSNEAPSVSTKLPLPMLAHPYNKRGHKIVWPAFSQPKLDGMRVLAGRSKDGVITYWSRNGKVMHTLDHLTEDLSVYMRNGEIFDGEVYIHGKPLPNILSLAKDVTKDTTSLEYWVFDMMVEGVNNTDRLSSLASRGLPLHTDSNTDCKVKLVETKIIADDEAMHLQHDAYVMEGFEGVIIRNAKGMYKLKHRSVDLQKYKEFIDEEFTIIAGVPDMDGGVVFTCKTKVGKEFGVRPKGTVAIRKQYYEDIGNLIGKSLTVRYQNMSPDGVPIFPVGIAVRDYE